MEVQLNRLVQTITDGITVGSLYALIALGYTLVFGILQFINFAHGDVFALGTWLAVVVAASIAGHAGLSAAAVPVVAVAACAGIGFCIEQFAYRPLRKAPRLNVLITAIGVSLLLENLGAMPWAFGTQPRGVPVLIPDRMLFTLAGVAISRVQLIVVGSAIVLMLGLQLFVFKTTLGSAMRAVSINPSAAALMGINVDRVISITFVTGSALAGAAGYLYALRHQSESINQTADSTWVVLGLKAFIAAVLGGIGNIRGAMLGGILIGLIENFGSQYLSSQYRDVYVFLLLILVLLVRPEGLLGKAVVEKV